MATTLQQQRELASGYLAPVVTATFFACAACGVVAALAWAYFTRFKRDRAVFKVLVGGLTLLTVVYTACMAKLAGKWAVVGVWNYSLFSRMPWEFSAYCCFGPAVVIVQLWFSWRVWVISGRKNWILTAVIAAGSLAALGCSLRIGIFCATHAKLVDFTQVRFVLVTWLSLLIAVDLLISLAVFYYIVFKPRRDSGGLLSSDSRIQSLASFTAKTNLASLILQILILALLLAFPNEFHFCTPSFLVTGVYVGSFIATLLARDPSTLRSSGGGTDPPWAGSGPAELPSFVLRMGGASEMPEMARREPERGAVALEMEEGRRPFDTVLSLSGTRDEHGPASVGNSGSSSSSEMMLPRLSYEGRGLPGIERSKPQERGK